MRSAEGSGLRTVDFSFNKYQERSKLRRDIIGLLLEFYVRALNTILPVVFPTYRVSDGVLSAALSDRHCSYARDRERVSVGKHFFRILPRLSGKAATLA